MINKSKCRCNTYNLRFPIRYPVVHIFSTFQHHGKVQPVQTHITEVSLFDVSGTERFAITMGGQRVELAGAAEIAVAVDEFQSLETPVGSVHGAALL